MSDPTLRLLELDQRHSELLNRLDELNEQISLVLDDWSKAKEEQQNAEVDAASQCDSVAA